MSDVNKNDWRDFLAHYGVKGMKWGKHKRRDYIPAGTVGKFNYGKDSRYGSMDRGIYVRTEKYSKSEPSVGNKIGVQLYRGGQGAERHKRKLKRDTYLTFFNTTPGGLGKKAEKKYLDKYWQDENYSKKHNRKALGGVLTKEYAEDGVSYNINLSLAKRKVKSATAKAKSKAKKFLSKLFGR